MPASPDWRLVNFRSFLLLIWILPAGDGTTFAPLWNHVIVGFGIPVALHANVAASWGYLSIFDGVTLNVGWSIKNKIWKGIIHISRDSKEVTWCSTKRSWALRVFLYLRASSPYGEVVRCHARAARERRRQCEGREKKGELSFSSAPRSLAPSLARYTWRSCSQAAFSCDFEKGKICIKLTR